MLTHIMVCRQEFNINMGKSINKLNKISYEMCFYHIYKLLILLQYATKDR